VTPPLPDLETSSMTSTTRIRPADEHNAVLESHVHPPDWTNPTPEGRYNLVVVGAGTAGLVAAIGAAGLGARVALVERHLMGGDCLNVGCVPSKALIRAARAFAQVRDAVAYGVVVPEGTRVDFGAVMERMRRLRAGIAEHDSARRFTEAGVDVHIGDATFTGRDTLEVAGRTLRFKRACIATGARAALPPIEGLAEADPLTNETLFELTELPPRLAVIGGGPIGSEMAQAFARFGARVTLLEQADHVLAREDADAARLVQASMERDGVEILANSEVVKVEQRGDATVVHAERDGRTHACEVDRILVGVGRAPNVDGLGLEAAGVEYDERAGVTVDDRLRTSNPSIYAAGDVCSAYKFTHLADFHARLVLRNALFPGPGGKASALTLPWCTYTDPEVAHVGLDPQRAAERGIEVDTFDQPMAEVDRAILDGDTEGFVRIHVEKGKDRIVGATIVGRHAGELICEIGVAIVGGVGLGTVANTIHPYPTQAEAIRRAGDAYNRTRLTPFVAGLMKRWFAFTR